MLACPDNLSGKITRFVHLEKLRWWNMVEIESLETDMIGESLIKNSTRSNDLKAQSFEEDKTSRNLMMVIAICGFGIGLLLALALIAVIQEVFGLNLPVITAVETFLGSNSMGLVLLIVFAITALVSYFVLRRRVLGNPMLYSDAGCPQCWENELIRVRRQKSDRLIAHIGIPVRRYNCRNCDWAGLRLGGSLPVAETKTEDTSIDYF
jgi:hypothetical protein